MYAGYGRFWRSANLRVTVISSPGPDLERFGFEEEVETIGIPIERQLNPLSDILSLYRLWSAITHLRPDLVECGTPKAGLLGGLAARLAGVPALIYTLHGLRLETIHGWRRSLLALAERLSMRLADRTVAVSEGLLQRARSLALLGPDEGVVLGYGSVAGIDASRFAAISAQTAERETIGFIGRFTRDKGIVELLEAFSLLQQERPQVQLLLVGDFEDGDPVPETVRQRILSDSSIQCTGFVADAAPLYSEISIVALPSYREGFPLVALEAAAAARAIVAADCTGMNDAVIDGRTGILVPVGDAHALANALSDLLDDPRKAAQMGRFARGRVLRQFQPDLLWSEKLGLYQLLLEAQPLCRQSLQMILKRTLDIALSVSLLVVLLPLIVLVSLIVLVGEGRPIIFKQCRPGLGERPINVYKYRTMSNERDAQGKLLADSQRITALGKFLRRWSLDELPQLWSVLRGEMSLVGPRPLLTDYLQRYDLRQKRRFLVKPGITGWAQINGRNQAEWDERLEMDAWYADNWSFLLDLRILVRTVAVVFKGQGVEAPQSITPPPFSGVLQRRL